MHDPYDPCYDADFPLENRTGPWTDEEKQIVIEWWRPKLVESRRRTVEAIDALRRFAETGRAS